MSAKFGIGKAIKELRIIPSNKSKGQASGRCRYNITNLNYSIMQTYYRGYKVNYCYGTI